MENLQKISTLQVWLEESELYGANRTTQVSKEGLK